MLTPLKADERYYKTQKDLLSENIVQKYFDIIYTDYKTKYKEIKYTQLGGTLFIHIGAKQLYLRLYFIYVPILYYFKFEKKNNKLKMISKWNLIYFMYCNNIAYVQF